jgi:signal transduction histidine kinase
VFDASDGLRTLALLTNDYTPHVTKSPDGKLWFVAPDGISVVDPRRLPFNNLPPQVHIEQVTADRKTYDVSSGISAPVRLPPLIRDLEIDYTALSLVAPEKVIFRYKLEGRDRDWQDAGNRRQAFYDNLPPRNYRFRVVACNNSGVWNESGAFLDFSVTPAYYQTNWFRSACVIAFMAMLWGLYRLRVRQLAREFNAGLEARVNERTRIARELHDSMLQGFQGLMFRLQVVRDLLPGRTSEAMQALDVALLRGDKAIAEGRNTVADLRQPVVGDSDIAQALTTLGEELAVQSGNGATPGLRVLVEGKQRELNPMLRDEIYRIAREALRNAFRHAKAQKIEAEITYGDSEFSLYVRDDGLGIDSEVANQGARAGHWGLPGMRERARSFGGNLEVWSERGAGTEIALAVPASVAYGRFGARRRFWFSRKKAEEANGQQQS